MVYPRRNLPAEQWRSAQLLSLLSAPAAMLDPACCETVSPPSHRLSSCIYPWQRDKERGSGVVSKICFFQWCQAQRWEKVSQPNDAITVLSWRSATANLTLLAQYPIFHYRTIIKKMIFLLSFDLSVLTYLYHLPFLHGSVLRHTLFKYDHCIPILWSHGFTAKTGTGDIFLNGKIQYI